MQIHVVLPGESIWILSRRYGVAPQAIIDVNELTDPQRLVVGQALVIPTAENLYFVQPGDTLWSIARRLNTSIDELARLNPLLNPAEIYPGQVIRLPERTRPPIEVNAYLERMGERGREIIADVGEYLTYISLFSYQVRENGELVAPEDETVLQAARDEGAAPLMVITNFSEGRFRPEIAAAVFREPVRETLLDNIVETLQTKGYVGLNIDFEYVNPEDRENYNAFLRAVVTRLRPLGFLVSSALAPKVGPEQRGRLYEAHDYPVHGELLDFVILMTYEWGWSGGPPLPVAPINEVRRVLNYAVSVIPPQKILMGMPLYGYDWTLPYEAGGDFAPSLSPQAAVERAARVGAVIEYDETAESPFYNYYDGQGRQHIVWFEDARSVQAKFDTVRDYGLRGVSYWVLGNPFPQNWALLQDRFDIRKRL